MIKNVMKKLLGVTLAVGAVFTVTVSSYAGETSQEKVIINSEETEQTSSEETTEEENKEEAVTEIVIVTMESEYSFFLNEDGKILSIEGEKEALISEIVEQGKSLEESVKEILGSYQEETSYEVVLLVNNEEKGETILESLSQVVDKEKVEIEVVEAEDLEMENEETEAEGEGTPEFITKRFEMANQLGITPGKMNLLEKLAAASGEEMNYEEWSQKSVKDIMFEIKANRVKEDSKEDTAVVEDEVMQDQIEEDKEQDQEIEEKKEKDQSQGQGQSKGKGKSQGKSQSKGKNK